jgi:D-2-hydroxyglutarate dehydrogenase
MKHREGSVITDQNILEAQNTDWTKKYKGRSQLLLRPKTTQEVSSILHYCNEKRIGVVPQAGKTGLVGGSVPVSDEVLVDIRGLNSIEGINDSGILKCEAGCILQDLQTFAASHQYLMPVDLGSKGSCCIGGNVSTNAGGQYFYRYGSLHANVLGLEVVLPNGEILDSTMHVNLKDNTGYDWKHLFVGSEGTLGIITKVALRCPRLPRARNTAFLACNSYKNVQKTLLLAKDMLGEVLAAFEYMDRAVLDFVATEKRIPICQVDSHNYPYCVLVETHGSSEEHDMAKMEAFLEEAMTQELVADGVLSQDLRQVHEMYVMFHEYCFV